MSASELRSGLAFLKGLLPLFLVLLCWQLFFGGLSVQFPPPSTWWTSLAKLQSSGRLWNETLATLGTVIGGFVLASFAGLALGLLIGLSDLARRALSPVLEFFRALPPPVIVPVLIIWLGYAEELKLMVVVAASIWPVLLNVVSAVRRIEPLLLDVARSFHLSRAKQLRAILLPACLPAFFLGMRVALPIAIVVTLLVEILTGLPGIGSLMIQAQRDFKAAQVFGLLALVGILGFALNALFALVDRQIVGRWQSSRQGT